MTPKSHCKTQVWKKKSIWMYADLEVLPQVHGIQNTKVKTSCSVKKQTNPLMWKCLESCESELVTRCSSFLSLHTVDS